MMVKPTIRLVLAVLFLSSIASCGKKWIYFQEKDGSSNTLNNTKVSDAPDNREHVLTSGDIVGITINIAELDLSQVVSPAQQEAGYTISGYQIGEDSTITHPLIGKVKIGGLKIQDATNLITDSLAVNYKAPVVTVTLNGFRVTMLGEVGRPGIHYLRGSKVSIVDAVALAGDINDFGNPGHVKVIRNVDGVKKTEILDMTDLDVFKHPYFYLQSNDIVYVGALPRRTLRENITLITSLVTVVNSIAILSIRLNQK